MSMFPLPAHTVQLVLQYISPFTDSLPPHLLSTPLHQRHRFLQISPASTTEYLCWPGPDNAKIIDLLERVPPLSDQASYSTRYTSDPESVFAHAQISESLRIIFHWDAVYGWKYHNLRLMPFPSPSFSTPQESLESNSDSGLLQPESLDSVAELDHTTTSNDDSYWDAYGAEGDDLTFPSSESKPDAAEGEDAYWAQYASVQGSADSTIPSPLPINRKLRSVNHAVGEITIALQPQEDPVIDIPLDAIRSRPLTSSVGPLSPNTLIHLLNTISPRKDTFSPLLDDSYSAQSPSTYSVDPSSEHTAADSELVTPPMPNGDPDASPITLKANGVPLSKSCPRSLEEADDKALTDSIKGLYYLWRARGKGRPGEKDRSGFLRIVQAAITYD